jgi:hypothetical protein
MKFISIFDRPHQEEEVQENDVCIFLQTEDITLQILFEYQRIWHIKPNKLRGP